MASVTRRINMIQQPHGGYLSIHDFHKTEYQDQYTLFEEENLHPSLIGLAVDYLTRYMLGNTAEEAFEISLRGAERIKQSRKAARLLNKIRGLDSESIVSACKLSGYDVCYRSGVSGYKPIEKINPDTNTIENIRIMVIRSLRLFELIGPITKTRISFEGGYTYAVDSGDGDYMTADALWDLKVSKRNPTSKHTLQILMYYIMGLHSIYPEFRQIKHLGFFNPRLNMAYTIEVEFISQETIQIVERDIICYGDTDSYQYATENVVAAFTVAEASEYLGIKKSFILNLMKKNVIHAKKVNNRYEINTKEMQKLGRIIRMQRTLQIIKFVLCIIIIGVFCFLVGHTK